VSGPTARAREGAPADGPEGAPVRLFQQGNQPEGVPPLALTGERTLPDVPEENYWYRRHLAVYEWIAARVGGLRVIDMACGEGYGSDVLARAAASVVGVDANPEAHEHARLRYTRGSLRFARDLVETFPEPADAVVFLQTIEHLRDPSAVLAHFRSLVDRREGAAPNAAGRVEDTAADAPVGGGGVVFVSTPNVLTLAPKGAERSDNPWHVHEYRSGEFEGLCRGTFGVVEMYGLFHARKLQAHALALKLGWDRVHPRLRLTKPFYDRFTPAIAASDFALRPAAEVDLDNALDFIAVCRP
jgi:SAM-dependent methyltransferase